MKRFKILPQVRFATGKAGSASGVVDLLMEL